MVFFIISCYYFNFFDVLIFLKYDLQKNKVFNPLIHGYILFFKNVCSIAFILQRAMLVPKCLHCGFHANTFIIKIKIILLVAIETK